MINFDLKTKEGIRNWLALFFKGRKIGTDLVSTGTLDIKYNPYPQFSYIGRYVSSEDSPTFVVDCYGYLYGTQAPFIAYVTRRLDPKYTRTQEITVPLFRRGGRDIFNHPIVGTWRLADAYWWEEDEEGRYSYRPIMYDSTSSWWYYLILMTYEDYEDSMSNKKTKRKKLTYDEFVKLYNDIKK